MHNESFKVLTHAIVFILLIIVAGCVSSGADRPIQPPAKAVPLFPPQSVFQSGNYQAFRAENEESLRSCGDPELCAVALFNLGFTYCYSKSPYYNPSKGLLYLEDLIKGAPESPWAYHARVWIDILKKSAKMETKKRPAKDKAKSRETPAEASKQPEQQESRQAESQQDVTSRGANPETDRQRLEEEIRSRDETIKELNRQIQRAHQIDIEIEKKERGIKY